MRISGIAILRPLKLCCMYAHEKIFATLYWAETGVLVDAFVLTDGDCTESITYLNTINLNRHSVASLLHQAYMGWCRIVAAIVSI